MKTIRDVRNWLTGLEQVVEDRVFLDQLRDMQIITRNIERDISELFDERNKLIPICNQDDFNIHRQPVKD